MLHVLLAEAEDDLRQRPLPRRAPVNHLRPTIQYRVVVGQWGDAQICTANASTVVASPLTLLGQKSPMRLSTNIHAKPSGRRSAPIDTLRTRRKDRPGSTPTAPLVPVPLHPGFATAAQLKKQSVDLTRLVCHRITPCLRASINDKTKFSSRLLSRWCANCTKALAQQNLRFCACNM